ncbi:MAG TPA: M48 family metalloprotease [Candidatus Binataceae bacterium]|nr:M48 family metalloprotease [Candidatus Binataceae bacterium]
MSELTQSPPPEPHEDFFAAQVRNRHATWRISALCAAAIAVAGIPLTLIITPLLYAAFTAAVGLLDYLRPLPPAFWRHLDEVARIGNVTGDFLFNHKHADPALLSVAAALFLGPGILVAILFWMGVYAILQRGGVGGALMTLGARAPKRSDPRELQLEDIVQEMALAARMQPTPRIVIIDHGAANAAAIGTSAADAHLIVSRELLDTLRREQMQGAIAHLIASIDNGDLRIAFRITSVFETCGLMIATLNAPFGPHARATLAKVARFALRRDHTNDGAEAEAITTALAAGAGTEENDISRFFAGARSRSLARKIINAVLLPFFFTNAAIQLTIWFLSEAMLAPAFAMLWRTRKYLADAGAVQLTRNPDATASALAALEASGGAIGARSATPFLFIVSPGQARHFDQAPRADQMEAALRIWNQINPDDAFDLGAGSFSRDDFMKVRARLSAMRLQAMRGDRDAIAKLAQFARAMAAMRAGEPRAGDEASGSRPAGALSEGMLSFHPSIRNRLARLRRMGAHIEDNSKPMSRKVEIILGLILGPLMLLMVAAMLMAIAVMILLNLFFLGLWFAIIHAIFALAIHH